MWNPCNPSRKQYFNCLILNKEKTTQETVLNGKIEYEIILLRK